MKRKNDRSKQVALLNPLLLGSTDVERLRHVRPLFGNSVRPAPDFENIISIDSEQQETDLELVLKGEEPERIKKFREQARQQGITISEWEI